MHDLGKTETQQDWQFYYFCNIATNCLTVQKTKKILSVEHYLKDFLFLVCKEDDLFV